MSDAADPTEILRDWIAAAAAADVVEPTAMTVSTVDEAGRPDARVVLCRGVDERGLRWFTNLRSAKARQLAATPAAAAVFVWPPLQRQVRLRGEVTRLPAEESDAYFAARPRDSQLSAWASRQSEPIEDPATLYARVEAVAARFGDGEVPRPDHWGGYLLRPDSVEFWEGRPARLHERIVYVRTASGWEPTRLQP